MFNSLNNNNFNKNNHKNLSKELINKGYFSSLNKKLIFSLYMIIKNEFNKKLGRKCKVSLIEQIMITLFKLRYNLPDRILEDLFRIDHVTISRIIIRISTYLSKVNINIKDKESNLFYIVDSTVLRIGKGKNNETYSGYKHHHGVKFQVTINDKSMIEHVSKSYSSSIHDKKLFIKEYKSLMSKINKDLDILGDKGYSGLNEYKVNIPTKRNEVKYKENKNLSKSENKILSSKRIKVEHVFAYIKSYRIMQRLNYYTKDKIDILFNSIANIYNLSQLINS
jgi:hypothetical protein